LTFFLQKRNFSLNEYEIFVKENDKTIVQNGKYIA